MDLPAGTRVSQSAVHKRRHQVFLVGAFLSGCEWLDGLSLCEPLPERVETGQLGDAIFNDRIALPFRGGIKNRKPQSLALGRPGLQ